VLDGCIPLIRPRQHVVWINHRHDRRGRVGGGSWGSGILVVAVSPSLDTIRRASLADFLLPISINLLCRGMNGDLP
jgi:hypothetical protein